MQILKKIVISFILLVLSIFFSYLTGYFYKLIYVVVYGSSPSGIFFIYEEAIKLLVIFILLLIFYTSLFFTAFGGSKKYWWIGVLLIPAAIFEIYFDLEHIYIPIAVGLLGWGVGFGISKLIKKLGWKLG